MPSSIIGDNLPAHRPLKGQKPDTTRDRPAAQEGPDRQAPGAAAKADVQRAQQRLTQELGTNPDPAIASLEEARARVARLHAQVAADPAAAMRAHGRLNPEALEAAVARPIA